MPKTVNMIDTDGIARAVPESEVDYRAARGWRPETAEDVTARTVEAAKEEAYGGVAGTASAAAGGVLRGFTGGLSDVYLRATGGEDERRKLNELKSRHQIASVGGEIFGSVLPGGIASVAGKAGKLAGAVEEGAGLARQIGGAVVQFGTEGAIYGSGNAVSELALTDHPLTAEHIASTLSSNMLLGAGVGGVTGGVFKAGERALSRASTAITEATAARAAIDGIPADIAKLDEAGLREAMTAAKAEHAADIAAERKSIEALRVEKRTELANQVRDFHAELATERPIFQAVAGEDVRAIKGVGTEIAAPLNKSYRTLRSAFDNPIAVAENPTSLLKPLQMQQTALENLQARAPEIQAMLGNDARAAALEHVDLALEQNKAFQAQIRALDKSTPVTGTRLAALEAAGSPKMQAIEAAREALKKAPELGAVAKAAKGAAFGGVTALAHMIPGVGIAAPFLGKGASDLVGKAFERLAGVRNQVASKSAETVKAFLNVAEKVPAPATVTATKVLSAVKFGAGPEPSSQKLPDLFRARSQEIRQQTEYGPDGQVRMRPEARLAMAEKLAPIAAVNPKLADQIETIAARKIAYTSSKIPKRPEIGGLQIGPDNWQPSELAMRSWARTIRAVEDPGSVEESLLHGTVTPEAAEAYRTVYRERFLAMQQAIFEAAPELAKTLPMKRKIALSVFTGVPLIPALQPNILQVLQSTFAVEPGSAGGTQAPQPRPNFGALGSMKSMDKPTPAQERGG